MSSAPKMPDPAVSPTYRLAALDQDFLLSDSLRGVRFHLEYEKPEQILRAAGIESTLVVFGSARSREDSRGDGARWYEAARRFGRLASEFGGACMGHGPLHNVIATGGGPGIMEAANRGASEAGAPTIGFNIALPHEQAPNPYITPALAFQFHYFAMRAAALVVFPGGFGTFDELFEILTLRQTRKMRPIPVVLFDEAFWRETINFEGLVRRGLISQEDLSIFRFAETPEQIWAELGSGLIDHSQKMTVAAMVMADMKVWAQRS